MRASAVVSAHAFLELSGKETAAKVQSQTTVAFSVVYSLPNVPECHRKLDYPVLSKD